MRFKHSFKYYANRFKNFTGSGNVVRWNQYKGNTQYYKAPSYVSRVKNKFRNAKSAWKKDY